eukprot:GHVT01082479.1.p1 GENE.GHVT01082479.1~~GHVT01082479.1.p1  ORF type:complete len:246 (-),score=26.81 GHVT01082479.1:744-1481(-)
MRVISSPVRLTTETDRLTANRGTAMSSRRWRRECLLDQLSTWLEASRIKIYSGCSFLLRSGFSEHLEFEPLLSPPSTSNSCKSSVSKESTAPHTVPHPCSQSSRFAFGEPPSTSSSCSSSPASCPPFSSTPSSEVSCCSPAASCLSSSCPSTSSSSVPRCCCEGSLNFFMPRQRRRRGSRTVKFLKQRVLSFVTVFSSRLQEMERDSHGCPPPPLSCEAHRQAAKHSSISSGLSNQAVGADVCGT